MWAWQCVDLVADVVFVWCKHGFSLAGVGFAMAQNAVALSTPSRRGPCDM